MAARKTVALAIAVMFALAPVMAAGQAATGTVSGNAKDEAKKPFTDYNVQLLDIESGQLTTTPLDAQGLFAFPTVPLSKKYLVVLYSVKDKRVVCSQGPYTIAAPDLINKNDVNLDCGVPATALWLLLAGAGTATAIAVTTQSPSR